MPIYEFTCQDCRNLFDVMGSYSTRTAAQVCPSCESTNTQAVFSTFASPRSADGVGSEVSTGGGCGGCGGGCSCASSN